MPHIWFDIIPDGHAWIVRCEAQYVGRYRSQIEAFNVAVAEARKLKSAGQDAQVRILRDLDAGDGL
jgi:hypothetical protein